MESESTGEGPTTSVIQEEIVPNLGDIVYAPSSNLSRALKLQGIESSLDFEGKVRAAKSIDDLRSLGLTAATLHEIASPDLIIDDEHIPEWMKQQIQRMVDFAVSSGAERPEGIGIEEGFNHIHLGINADLKLTGRKVPDWKLIQENLVLFLGHTQEMRSFDLKKRNVVLVNQPGTNPLLLSGSNNQGTTHLFQLDNMLLVDKKIADGGTLYFTKQKSGDLRFSAKLH